MKWFIASLLGCGLLGAQDTSVSTTTSVDVNGNRVTNGPQVVQTKTANGTVTTETRQSVNGTMVPLEKVEERVLRDDASGRSVERIIHRYDPQGNPTAPVKEAIEEQKRADGSSTVQTTTYRGDINGGMQLAQKTLTETKKNGSEETSQTVIQRPTINGSLDTVEKREQAKVTDASGGYREQSTTYRPSGNGGFYAAVKTSTEHTQQGTQSTDNTAEYEAPVGGDLALHSQTVTKTVTGADGSKDTVVDIFGTAVPGKVNADGGMKLQERQLIQATKGPGGAVTQTLSVQRPSVSDPASLGAPQQLSQTVCTGNCKP